MLRLQRGEAFVRLAVDVGLELVELGKDGCRRGLRRGRLRLGVLELLVLLDGAGAEVLVGRAELREVVLRDERGACAAVVVDAGTRERREARGGRLHFGRLLDDAVGERGEELRLERLLAVEPLLAALGEPGAASLDAELLEVRDDGLVHGAERVGGVLEVLRAAFDDGVAAVEHDLRLRVAGDGDAARGERRDDVRGHRAGVRLDLDGRDLLGRERLHDRDIHLAAGEDVAAVAVDDEVDRLGRRLERRDDARRGRDDALVDPGREELVVVVCRDDGAADFNLCHFLLLRFLVRKWFLSRSARRPSRSSGR